MYQASNKRIAKNTILLYLRMLVVMGVGLYTSRVVLASLGVRDFGLYNVVGAVVGMLTFLNASMSTAGSRFLTCILGKDDLPLIRKTWSTLINTQAVLAILTVLVLFVVGFWLVETKANIPAERLTAVRFAFYCAMITTAIGLLTTPFSAAIIAYERMDAFAWFSIIDVVAKLLIAYAVALTGHDKLKFYAAMMALSQALYSLANVSYCKIKFRTLRYMRTLDWRLIREIYSFAGWHLLTMIAVMLSTQGLTFLNQRYFGPELVAAFALAVSVETHVMSFVNNFRAAANPQIVKTYATGQFSESKDILINSTLLAFFLYLMLAVPIFIFADQILSLWLLEVPRWSVPFVRICLVNGLISVFDISLYMGIYANGHLVENATVNVCLGFAKFLLAWVVISKTNWPYSAAVVQCSVYAVTGFISKPLILRKRVAYRWPDFRRLLFPSVKIFAMTVLIAVATYKLTPSGILWMICGGILCATLIGVCNWYIGVPLAYRQKVMAIVRKKIGIV